MPRIADAAAAKKLLESTKTLDDHKRLREFRAVRDRKMQSVLDSFKPLLRESLADAWVPYQSEEPNDEINTLKHLLVSNAAEIEVLVKSTESARVKLGQELENALQATDETLFPIDVQLDECEFLGDGYSVLCLEKVPGSPNLARYAGRKKLEAYAEDDDKPEPGEYDDGAEATYRRAYRSLNGTGTLPEKRNLAYKRVTDEARLRDGLRWRVRVVDPETFEWFEERKGEPQIGIEHGQRPVNAVLQAFSNYGLALAGDRWVVRREEGKAQEHETGAYGAEILPQMATATSWPAAEMVDWIQIRTLEETVVYFGHPKGGTEADPGEILRFPNLFGGKSIGYYIVAGNTKLRGNRADRYDPPVAGLLVETQQLNVVRTILLCQALEEVARDVYQERSTPAVQPADRTQQTKGVQPKQGREPPVAAGEVKRIPTTDVKMDIYHEVIQQGLDRFRSRELYAGSGSSSETGVHLARLQTMLLTKLVPYQVRRAQVRKLIFQDLLCYVLVTGERLVVPWLPKDTQAGDRRAEAREITREMASLPADIRITIGADTPESKHGRSIISQQQTDFGAISMTTHRENIGLRDPMAEVERIVRDNLVQAAIGTPREAGWLPKLVTQMLQTYAERYIASKLPPPPPTPSGIIDPRTGLPFDGGAVDPRVLPPGGAPGAGGAQVMPGGAIVAPGGAPAIVGAQP